MEANDEHGKHDNEALLHAYAYDVDFHADPLGVVVAFRPCHHAARSLDEKAYNVGPDEQGTYPGGMHPGNDGPSAGAEKVNHAGKDHVDEGIEPHGRQQEERLITGRKSATLLVPRSKRVYRECCCLPRRCHEDGPCEQL